jgi:hypothetical protein
MTCKDEPLPFDTIKICAIIISSVSNIFYLFLFGVNLYYIYAYFKRLSYLWSLHFASIICLLGLSITGITHISCVNQYDNSIKFTLFVVINSKLVFHLITGFRILSSSMKRVSLMSKSVSLHVIIFILSLMLLGGISFIGFYFFNYENQHKEKLFKEDFYPYLLNSALILFNFFLLCLITRNKSTIFIQTDIFLKIIFLDCLASIMIICLYTLNYFADIVIIFGLLFNNTYSYFQTQLMLKYDISEYYEDNQNTSVYDSQTCLKNIFYLESFLSEFSEIEHFIPDRRNVTGSMEKTQNDTTLTNSKSFDKSKEFVYFNFCILSEIYTTKLKHSQIKIDQSFESRESNNKFSLYPEKTLIKFNHIVDKYFPESQAGGKEIIFNNFINYFANQRFDQENVMINSYHSERFEEMLIDIGINYTSVIDAVNPLKNMKICKNLEKKMEMNHCFNEFYSHDCFISFELYDSNKINQISNSLKSYFEFMKNCKKSFYKTYLPLLIACYELKYLNQHYIILLYRNPYAFSVFHEMKHYFMISIDDLEKKVAFTSNPMFEKNIVSSNEIEIMHDIFLQDDDYKDFKITLKRDLEYLKSTKMKYYISIFIMNDNFTQNSDLPNNNRITGSRISNRFDFSILDRFSEFSSNPKLPPSTLSCYEDLFVIKYNRNSRYIIKTFFNRIFSDFSEKRVEESYKQGYI